MAAKMTTIAMTIINSIRVSPRCRFLTNVSPLDPLFYANEEPGSPSKISVMQLQGLVWRSGPHDLSIRSPPPKVHRWPPKDFGPRNPAKKHSQRLCLATIQESKPQPSGF